MTKNQQTPRNWFTISWFWIFPIPKVQTHFEQRNDLNIKNRKLEKNPPPFGGRRRSRG